VRVIECTWWDAWISTEDIKLVKARKLKPVKRSTVGYLVADCDNWIILSTDRFHKGQEVSAPMVIPKGMILETYEYVKENK